MKERRQYQRFPLTLPAKMEMITPDKRQLFDFETRNISASGALIYSKESFPEGTRFKINLTVASEKIKALTGTNSLIKSEGNVVRSSQTDIAINFERKCQILSLKPL